MEIRKSGLAEEALEKGLSKFEEKKKEGVNLLLDKVEAELEPVRKMIADYECAAMEVETKFKVLNTRFAVNGEKNPIESIKTRVKSADSILRKMDKLGLPIDIYAVEKLFLDQEDVKLVTRKDYIENPKESGYRSLHLIIQTPIYTENGEKDMYVEVQMRTIAMDFWASLDHKLRYKKNIDPQLLSKLAGEMEDCAKEITKLDKRMLAVRQRILEVEEPEG